MREGYPKTNLGDVCSIIGGGTPSKDRPEYFQGDIPWATVRDLKGDVITKTDFRITEDAVASSATKIISAPNVIIATRVGLGKVCRIEQDTALNQDLRAIVPNDDKELDRQFLFWWLKSVAHEIVANGTGATVQGVKLPFVKGLQIPLPPLAEQKRIVAVLDEAFAGIKAAAEAARKNLASARELFETTLNATFTQKGEGWVETTVEHLVQQEILDKPLDGNHGEIHPKKAEFVNKGVPFVMASDLAGGVVDQVNCHFISHEQAGSLRKGFAKNGDVLLSHKGTIGRVAILTTAIEYVVLTPQVTYYRILDEAILYNGYLFYFFQSPKFQKEIGSVAGSGSTRAYIGITKQLALQISYPSILQQIEIAATLAKLSGHIERLEALYQRKLDALEELKQSLLQKAFAGALTQAKEAAA